MQWITVAEPPFESLEELEAVIAGFDRPPEGMEARYIGTTAGGALRIVSLWESKAHADRFLAETLGPALASALGPEPAGPSKVEGIDVARQYVRQPVR